jgi:hypothetical protein
VSPPSTRSMKRPVDHHALYHVFNMEEDSIYPPGSTSTASSHHHVYRRKEDRQIPLVYSSLPSSPISTSPPPHETSPELPLSPTFPPNPQSQDVSAPPFSLWDYLREELLATDFDSHQELKWERVSNFLNIPLAMEKVRPITHFTSNLQLVLTDNRLWLYPVPRLLSIHVHYPPHPVHSRISTAHKQRIPFFRTTSSSGSEGRHPAHAPSRLLSAAAVPSNRRKQNLPFDTRARHHQVVCNLQCT